MMIGVKFGGSGAAMMRRLVKQARPCEFNLNCFSQTFSLGRRRSIRSSWGWGFLCSSMCVGCSLAQQQTPQW